MSWQLAFEYLRRLKSWRKASWIPLLAVAVLADPGLPGFPREREESEQRAAVEEFRDAAHWWLWKEGKDG